TALPHRQDASTDQRDRSRDEVGVAKGQNRWEPRQQQEAGTAEYDAPKDPHPRFILHSLTRSEERVIRRAGLIDPQRQAQNHDQCPYDWVRAHDVPTRGYQDQNEQAGSELERQERREPALFSFASCELPRHDRRQSEVKECGEQRDECKGERELTVLQTSDNSDDVQRHDELNRPRQSVGNPQPQTVLEENLPLAPVIEQERGDACCHQTSRRFIMSEPKRWVYLSAIVAHEFARPRASALVAISSLPSSDSIKKSWMQAASDAGSSGALRNPRSDSRTRRPNSDTSEAMIGLPYVQAPF